MTVSETHLECPVLGRSQPVTWASTVLGQLALTHSHLICSNGVGVLGQRFTMRGGGVNHIHLSLISWAWRCHSSRWGRKGAWVLSLGSRTCNYVLVKVKQPLPASRHSSKTTALKGMSKRNNHNLTLSSHHERREKKKTTQIWARRYTLVMTPLGIWRQKHQF